MALALHLCLGRTPGRITRHVGGVRDLPPPRVGLLTLSPGVTDLEYEAEGGTEMLTLSLPSAVFAAVDGRPEAAFARGLLPSREEDLRAVLQDLAERVAQVRASAFMSTAAGIPSPSRATPRSRIEARRQRTYRVSPLRVVSQAPRASIQR
jgi:hypothetical protein